MTRLSGIGASLALALLIVTCVDNSVGPGRLGIARLNFAALASGVAGGPVPVDSLEIALSRPADQSVALDSILGFNGDTAKGDSGVVRLNVGLRQSPEDFLLSVRAFGGGITWYTASSAVQIAAGAAAAPALLTLKYVGPGVNAAFVTMAPVDTTVIGGVAFPLRATVYDSNEGVIKGVPVAYRLSDTSRATISYPTPYAGLFTGRPTVRDSVWVVAETPTHIKDSTRVRIIPPAAALTKISGDNQTGLINAPLPVPFIVRVLDLLNGGFKGQNVTWSVASGSGTLSATTTVSDDSGYATVTLTPTALGLISVRASAGSLTGSPQTFTFGTPVTGPTNLVIVSGDLQSDTVRATLAPYKVKVTDALNNPVAGAKVSWTRISGSGSVSADTTVTDAAGLSQITYTLGTLLGPEQVRAALVGGTNATVIFNAATAAGTGTVFSTTVAPHLDTLTALTATIALAAQGKNAASNPVAGAFTWVSRAPAFATVNAAGLVTAVANGTSYVVATEAGGTKDSGLVVVQQRVTTINVTPGARSIYLPRSFAFAATALDGLGNPLAGVTSFTWSSTAPAVASVDAAGNVTALGLGTAQIRATAGAVTGVANVSVITPITRIAVVVDTVGASKTDTFTLTSLGLTRRYRAVAHDTLDAVMSGVSFTWVSTNGSVAVLGSNGGDTTTATSAANGVTQIRATAQGFTSAPGALLTVSQVLASIALSPPASNPTATIGITGTVGLVARGKDANGRFIAGGSFRFASATPAVATVDTLSGVVIGVSNGTSDITASSGAITSNALTVTVGGTVPAIISFGRDTVSVGRGSSASIPILLSKPAGAPLTLNLTASAFAHWSTSSIVIPANVASINATLVGDSAGTGTVTATDPTGLYATASAVAKVTANMRLAAGGYAINVTDVANTQVLLSDPSPAGGTYVSFNYSTPGIASVSPDPAFIPAGQLAADIQIRALAAGTTTITPNAIGVNGTASGFTAYPAVLTPSTTAIRLGAGQNEPNVYVYVPTTTTLAVPVTLTSSDTNVVTVTPSVTVPANSYYAYFTASARAIGSATITLSAPGWTASGTIGVTSTPPDVGICCGISGLFTTSPQQTVTVYAEDSTRTAHARTNSLVVRLTSRDTTVIRVLDTVVTIQPGQSYNSSGRFIMGGQGGSAYVVATAGGHGPDSALYTVAGPPLTFSWGGGTPLLGAGQQEPNVYVYVPNNTTAPVVVTLSSSDSTLVSVPASVTIPKNSYYAYFTVVGSAPGSVTIHATAPGYNAVNGAWRVTPPRITACCSGTFNNFNPGGNITVYSTDSAGNAHARSAPLAVSLASLDGTVVTIDSSTVTIDSAQYSNSKAHITPVGVGTARIIYAASDQLVLDTLTINVVTPPIQFSFSSALLGRRQHFDANNNGFYVYTPDSRATPLAVTITQRHGTVVSLTTTAPTIPTTSYYAYLDAYGLATGADTLIVTAPGYRPDTAFITVTTPQFTNCCMPAQTTTTNPPIGITVYATDSVGSAHYTMDTLVVAALSSDTTAIRPAQPFFRILKNTEYAQSTVDVVGPGLGPARITYSDSAATGYLPTTTGSVTVTGPSLALANGTPVLGMRQTGSTGTGSSYVYVPNSVATPLVVNLLSTGTRVATVPPSVTIPAQSYYAYFDVTAQDTVGTIQIQASATGYGPTVMNVQVTQPKFVVSTSTQRNTTSSAANITIYAADANGTAHYTTENVTVTLASSAPSVASIDSPTVTILSGASYVNAPKWSPGLVGTAQLSASDARAAPYRYNTGTANVAVVTPPLSLSWGSQSLGIGQYVDEYVTTPDNAAVPINVLLSHTGTARTSTLVAGVPVTGITIPQGTYYTYFRTVGTSAGTDTLVATATLPAHTPATAYSVVGLGRIDPVYNWPSTLKVGDSVLVTLYALDQAGNEHYVLNPTTYTLAPNANMAFVSGGAAITSITMLADHDYVQFYVKGVTAGNGSADITATNYQPYSNTVTITP